MSKESQLPIITVDGPSGVGKGTVCASLAKRFNFNLLDSGALYRVLAIASIEEGIACEDEIALAKLAQRLEVKFVVSDSLTQVHLNEKNISAALRHEQTGAVASKIAVFAKVRDALLHRQQAFAVAPGLIADGRDMGTIVFPDAQIKVFLDASAQERTKRRVKQLQVKGLDVIFENILTEIQERDHRDRNRAVAPLKPADDAVVIDTTELSIEEVFQKITQEVAIKLPELLRY